MSQDSAATDYRQLADEIYALSCSGDSRCGKHGWHKCRSCSRAEDIVEELHDALRAAEQRAEEKTEAATNWHAAYVKERQRAEEAAEIYERVIESDHRCTELRVAIIRGEVSDSEIAERYAALLLLASAAREALAELRGGK